VKPTRVTGRMGRDRQTAVLLAGRGMGPLPVNMAWLVLYRQRPWLAGWTDGKADESHPVPPHLVVVGRVVVKRGFLLGAW